jgi:uncharacterized GH25 family protein
MRKQFTLIVVLLTIAFSSFNVMYKILPAVHATYVEGAITRDTIWTLVDSPFILSNNVTVNSGATLTIEPGVQVKFGGDFCLVVNGRIVANGTEDKIIYFTANDPTQTILGRTILITGTQQSLFINCVIEHTTNGTTLAGGVLDIENSIIRSNLQSGIVVNSGTLTVKNSEIVNNTGIAIAIAGGDQVNIQDNSIEANQDGITLSRLLTGTISISQNEIGHNAGAGIAVQANMLANTVIDENNIIANGYGVLVTSNISTYIANNYISNNAIGIHYASGFNHRAEFNDIYENGIGMDLDLTAMSVDATHNYWGHGTGPKHISVNPHGKGNSVGGDGANLIFIPFLTHSFTYNNAPPTAVLWTDKTIVAPNQPVTYVGTDSQDDGSIYQYLFDFSDTINSGWTPLTLFNHSYSSTGTYVASLKVQDDFGASSQLAFATINVVNLVPMQVSVTLSNSTIPYNGDMWVTAYVSNDAGPVANANVALFSVKGGSYESQTGLTDNNGYFTTKFTAPNVTQSTDVRIIARGSMAGYADGSDYKYVRVLSPLKIQIIPAQNPIESEEAMSFDVFVTDYFGDPVVGVYLTLSCSNGALSNITGITDANGIAIFTFTAPPTINQLNITLTIGASKNDYADGQQDAYIDVEPKRLVVTVAANPDKIVSGEASTITANVTWDAKPVENATVTVSSDVGGNFSVTTRTTDLAGISRFAFTAPQTSTADGINATITVTAVKDGYVGATNQAMIAVNPKVMSIEIIPHSNATLSNAKLNITVQATYNNTSVEGANVTITATNGTFDQTTGITDNYGNVTFTFNAPQVNQPYNITFSATATEDGYLEATDQLDVPVNPRTFALQIAPSAIRLGQDQTLTLHVTCKEDGTPADAAMITITYENGPSLTNTTDENGSCTFMINAPQTVENQQNISIIVTASRIGYQDRQVTMMLNVIPSEGGFPWLTILVIAIPVAILVLVVVLIKMKLIVVSSKEEETGSE